MSRLGRADRSQGSERGGAEVGVAGGEVGCFAVAGGGGGGGGDGGGGLLAPGVDVEGGAGGGEFGEEVVGRGQVVEVEVGQLVAVRGCHVADGGGVGGGEVGEHGVGQGALLG